MNYFERRRYAVRYGSRRTAAVRWLLTGGLLVALAAGYTYMHHRDRPSASAVYIIAPSGTANEPGPVLSASVLQMLRSAAQTSNMATAYVISPGSGQPDILALTPYLPNGDVDYGPTRSSTLNANLTAVQRAVEHQAALGPFDLLATITAAIKVTPPPATLIVVSSGLSTAGGFDLRLVGWSDSPSSVATQLKTHGLLPHLAGYEVWFSGLGDTAGRQPALPLPAQTTLASYWLDICRAAGAASCRTDETTRAAPPSRSTFPVPVVPVPSVWTVHGPHHTTTKSLPDTLLFRFGSSALVSSADTILQPIAARARSQDLLVSIVGTASPDGGTSAYNYHLSVRRAYAVRDRLITLGLPSGQITRVTGVGTAGRSPGACIIHGQLDEAICAQLRQVILILSPATVTM
jgi:outer membrane protein OmpA-like peptidoglycan-associated protein